MALLESVIKNHQARRDKATDVVEHDAIMADLALRMTEP